MSRVDSDNGCRVDSSEVYQGLIVMMIIGGWHCKLDSDDGPYEEDRIICRHEVTQGGHGGGWNDTTSRDKGISYYASKVRLDLA